MGLDLTTFDAALKQHYTDQAVENQVYMDNPLLALMPKYENFGGRNLPITTIWGNPQGRSATFARAQARSLLSNSKLSDFLLTRVKDYSIATIDNETIEASKGDANAMLEAATVEVDGAINSLTRSLAVAAYRSGYGDIGQVTGAVNTTTLTLSNASDITNFEVGMELTVSATQSGAERALGSSGNGLLVTSIDRVAGTLGFVAAINDATNGIPAIAAADYIFIRGDHSSSSRTKVSGLEAWLPFTAPTSGDNFFHIDRSLDVTRLAGQRLDISAGPIEEGLIDAAAQVGREGGKLSHYFMTYAKYAELEKALGSKVQYIDLKVNAEVGFRGIVINGPRGPIKVIADQNCPSNRVFGLSMDMWKLYSLGKAVRVIDTDGMTMLRQAAADGVEVRYGFYGNLGCKAPGHNIVLKV
jgi:hypothetical protein